ncbi:MAG: type IV secretory system conjugative DNA transfer family protein [Lachnospiraceae bacterium]|nr:type IV secretory system conjugative DNA transfer family protein [Lachnospiraceae bacterium]
MDDLKEKLQENWRKWLFIGLGGLLGMFILGGLTNALMAGLGFMAAGEGYRPDFTVFISKTSFIYGFVEALIIGVVYVMFLSNPAGNSAKRMLNSKAERVEGALENSRWMEEKERNELFPKTEFSKLGGLKKDGIPLYAVYNSKKKDMDINIMSPAHGIIIGATGSGKTTTFVNPVVQILGHSCAGSSMICTDPKGELFQMHSKLLADHGYKCMVLDLRDPYSSFRWNPLGSIYDNYQHYVTMGDDIYERTDDIADVVASEELKLMHKQEEFGDVWYEWDGCAWAVRVDLINKIRVERQKVYDECYEDLNDLISVICPIENEKDPVWEKGARSIIMAVCLGMLEDSENPSLEMTKDKFCFYNINKAIGNSEDEYAALKDYFEGRSKLSKAAGLSRQVLSAADQTLASYMSIALDKLAMFNDEGLCALTSATDIQPEQFGFEPTALFLKIPDEKDTRHGLAAVFILCIYKALIKVASTREDLSLPRNVFFLLDEFGNMPKIDKFDKMITVGRSRKIWFEMIVQSFEQLKNVYGETIANIVKGNCGIKLFIGSNDIPTCEEFSKMCGNMTVRTQSVSSGLKDKTGNVNISSQVQTRPLIYPSELTRLNNAKSTGNSIVVTFNNFPLMTKFTPSYKCPLYEFGQMDLTDVRSNVFFGDEIYYDLDERNYLILDQEGKEDADGEAAEDAEEYEDGAYEDEEYEESGESEEAYEDEEEEAPAENGEAYEDEADVPAESSVTAQIPAAADRAVAAPTPAAADMGEMMMNEMMPGADDLAMNEMMPGADDLAMNEMMPGTDGIAMDLNAGLDTGLPAAEASMMNMDLGFGDQELDAELAATMPDAADMAALLAGAGEDAEAEIGTAPVNLPEVPAPLTDKEMQERMQREMLEDEEMIRDLAMASAEMAAVTEMDPEELAQAEADMDSLLGTPEEEPAAAEIMPFGNDMYELESDGNDGDMADAS